MLFTKTVRRSQRQGLQTNHAPAAKSVDQMKDGGKLLQTGTLPSCMYIHQGEGLKLQTGTRTGTESVGYSVLDSYEGPGGVTWVKKVWLSKRQSTSLNM